MNSDKNQSSDFIYRIRALIQNYKEDKIDRIHKK